MQDPLTKYLRANQILHKKKDTGPWTTSSGWPDLEIFPDGGKMFFIECKAPGKPAEPLQLHIHEQLRAAGYPVYVVDSKHRGYAIINKHCGLE